MGAHPRAEPGRSRIQTPAQRHQRPGSLRPTHGLLVLRRRRVHAPSAKGEFTPEGVAVHAWWGAVFWAGAAIFLWMALRSMSTAHVRVGAPLLDVVAYAGPTRRRFRCRPSRPVWTGQIAGAQFPLHFLGFVGTATWAPTAATAWGALSGAVFVVKTTKRRSCLHIQRGEASRGGREHAQLSALGARGGAVSAPLRPRWGVMNEHTCLRSGERGRGRRRGAARRRFVSVTHANGDDERR